MVILAVFLAGFLAGFVLGVFCLIILEIAVCAIAFVGNWSAGFVAACAHSLEMGMILVAGFLVALIVSALSPNFEREVARWLRRRRSRDHRLMHGPQ